MSEGCMSGMPMPGCGEGGPVGTLPSSPSSELVLTLCLVLSAYALTVALLSIGQWDGCRSRAPHRGEMLGTIDHAIHAGGMIAMTLWMAGAFTFEATWPYLALYGLAGFVFLIRVLFRSSLGDRLRELWHVLANGSMAYMFSGANLVFATVGCLVLLALLMLGLAGSRSRVPPSHAPSSFVPLRPDPHLAIGLTMTIMLAAVQWPSLLRWQGQ